jgi:hypothetical protein
MNAVVESLEPFLDVSDLSVFRILDEGFFLWAGSWVVVFPNEIMFYLSLFSIFIKRMF